MASKALSSVGKAVVQRVQLQTPSSSLGASNVVHQSTTATFTATGAVKCEPDKIPMGLLKVAMTVLPGLYIGATVSKTGAAFLEENDIFVPDDDDDDDD